jgi:hypothetical protein
MTTANVYSVNLNINASERWKHIINDNAKKLLFANENIRKEIRKTLGFVAAYITFPIFFTLVSLTSWILDPELLKEMKGISKYSGISLRNVLMLNIGYDFLAKCTSSTVYDERNNKIWHLRNMDWDSDLLRDMTIHVRFIEDDAIKYECITWIGFVGIMTAARHLIPKNTCNNINITKNTCSNNCICPQGKCTISLNFRKEDNMILRNIFRYLVGYQPCSFAIRRWLQYGNNKELFSTLAPCYLTIGTNAYLYVYELGKNMRVRVQNIKDNKLIIFDNQGSIELSWHNNNNNGNINLHYLVQTNTDYGVTKVTKEWTENDPLLENSVERLCVTESEIKKYNELNFTKCFSIMETEPVKNDLTVYTTIMRFDLDAEDITLENLCYAV